MTKPEDYRAETVQLVLATIALSVLSLALPVMTLQVYDRVLPNPDSGTLPVLITGVCVAILLEAGLRIARSWLIGWSGAVYEHAMSTAAMEHVLEADPSKSARLGAGEYLHSFGCISRMKDFFNGYALVTLVETAFIPLFLGIIFYIAPPLAVIPATLLAVFAVIAFLQGKKVHAEAGRRDETDDERYDFLIECLKGVHTVKAFALEGLFARRYEHLQERSGLGSFRTAEAATESFNAGTTLSHLMMAAITAAGALFVLSGQVTTGALIATLLLSGRLMQPVQRALILWAKYQDYKLAREKLAGIFEMPKKRKPVEKELPPAEGKLSLNNISYGGILKDVSLKLEPGESAAISGPAGSGKTVLMELIAGLYPPDSGTIEIDGVHIQDMTPDALSRRVGYLQTEGCIFRGTIRDNITRFGQTNIDQTQEVARLLAVDRDVAQLRFGFDTPLQVNGTDRVPAGLRQRIAITRALAPRPKIILFDSADRSLDREGYDLIFALMARLARKTALVLVTDDANISSLARRHFMLQNGALHEIATPMTRKAS